MQVEQAWSGSKYSNTLDRFTLLIPYCLDTIKCQYHFKEFTQPVFYFILFFSFLYWLLSLSVVLGDVIYNAEFPHAPPDVIFGPEDEGFHPFYNESGGEGDSRSIKNSLATWNNKDPTRLLALIWELRLCFEFLGVCF